MSLEAKLEEEEGVSSMLEEEVQGMISILEEVEGRRQFRGVVELVCREGGCAQCAVGASTTSNIDQCTPRTSPLLPCWPA